MKATFFHDTTFVFDNNKYYTYGTMNKEKFDEYKKYFGDITAVVKVMKKNDSNKDIIQEKNYVGNIGVKEVLPNYRNVINVVRKQMKETDFAIIRMHSIIGIVACKEARKNKIPYMIEMVSCPHDALWYHGGIKYKILMPIIVAITKYELKKSKNTIYVTNKFLQKRYPTGGKFIGCSDVKLKSLSNNVLENRLKKITLKKENEVYKLGLIGSLNVGFKGHKIAIKAISKLNKNINIELHFLSSGNKEKWINCAKKNKVEDKVFFDGVLPHDEVYNWLDEIDIFLNPSLQEGLPRALIEAMSRGCPALGSTVGGIPELLNEKFIISNNSYKQLSKLITNLIENKELMKEAAIINFDKSKEYEKQKLDLKKANFYKQIFKEISD